MKAEKGEPIYRQDPADEEIRRAIAERPMSEEMAIEREAIVADCGD